MTRYQILVATWTYLDRAWMRNPDRSDEYIDYISNVNPTIRAGEGTADPAYYADFRRIIATLMDGDECAPEDGLTCARQYLRAYNVLEHEQFSGHIDEVVEVFDGCTLEEWLSIVNDLKP